MANFALMCRLLLAENKPAARPIFHGSKMVHHWKSLVQTVFAYQAQPMGGF
jgi:hypothetical protein